MAARSTKSLRLGELRLIREVTFPAPADFTTAVRSPRDVLRFMAPFAAREVAEVFWVSRSTRSTVSSETRRSRSRAAS
jgi:hypothetical protein